VHLIEYLNKNLDYKRHLEEKTLTVMEEQVDALVK
jgi:hypothetical protein